MTGPVAIFIMMMMMMLTDKIYFHAIAVFTMMMIILSKSYPNTNMTGFNLVKGARDLRSFIETSM